MASIKIEFKKWPGFAVRVVVGDEVAAVTYLSSVILPVTPVPKPTDGSLRLYDFSDSWKSDGDNWPKEKMNEDNLYIPIEYNTLDLASELVSNEKILKIQRINFLYHPSNCCFCFTNCLNIPEHQAVAIHTSSVVYLFEQTNYRITLSIRELDQHVSFINDEERRHLTGRVVVVEEFNDNDVGTSRDIFLVLKKDSWIIKQPYNQLTKNCVTVSKAMVNGLLQIEIERKNQAKQIVLDETK